MIPNIYSGNYKLLVLIPLALILFAGFYIPKVELGVDFKGGLLFRANVNQNIDVEAVKNDLIQANFPVNKIRTYQDSIGNNVLEIEMSTNEKLADIEKKKNEFVNQIENLSRMESEINTLKQQNNLSKEKEQEFEEKKQYVYSLADYIFEQAELTNRSNEYKSNILLKKDVENAYRLILRQYETNIKKTLEKKYEIDEKSISIESVSASLSEKFIEQAEMIIAASILFSIIVIFIIFKKPIPSIAVITGALSDIIIALGFMGLLGIPLSLASFASILMLIGYSLDTDVLLTMKVIKGKEDTPRKRAYETMKTGISMSATSIVAFGSLFILALITNISIYYEISSVVLIGLFADIIATWCLNAVMILWYVERRG